MAHTPAPWELMPSGTLRSQDGTHIGTLSMNGALIESEFNANASLIAAAPELLEMVERLDTILRGMGPMYATGATAAEVKALIAKAGGAA